MELLLLRFKVLLVFYRSIATYTFIFSGIAARLYWKDGWLYLPWMFWTKLVGYALVTYFVLRFRPKDFYFYHNQNFSKRRLFLAAYVLDSLLFVLLIFLLSLFSPVHVYA